MEIFFYNSLSILRMIIIIDRFLHVTLNLNSIYLKHIVLIVFLCVVRTSSNDEYLRTIWVFLF